MGESLGDHICVIDHIATEDETAANSEDEVHGALEGDEHADNASHHCDFISGRYKKTPNVHLHSAMRPANSQDPIPEKSYCGRVNVVTKARDQALTFDWRVNRVRPMNTPTVINLGSVIDECSPYPNSG